MRGLDYCNSQRAGDDFQIALIWLFKYDYFTLKIDGGWERLMVYDKQVTKINHPNA
jgi:hypothetical protein